MGRRKVNTKKGLSKTTVSSQKPKIQKSRVCEVKKLQKNISKEKEPEIGITVKSETPEADELSRDNIVAKELDEVDEFEVNVSNNGKESQELIIKDSREIGNLTGIPQDVVKVPKISKTGQVKVKKRHSKRTTKNHIGTKKQSKKKNAHKRHKSKQKSETFEAVKPEDEINQSLLQRFHSPKSGSVFSEVVAGKSIESKVKIEQNSADVIRHSFPVNTLSYLLEGTVLKNDAGKFVCMPHSTCSPYPRTTLDSFPKYKRKYKLPDYKLDQRKHGPEHNCELLVDDGGDRLKKEEFDDIDEDSPTDSLKSSHEFGRVISNTDESEQTSVNFNEEQISIVSLTSKENSPIEMDENYTDTNSRSIPTFEGVISSRQKNQCNICLRVCRDKSALINHMRIHTGEKPYECDFCEKRFSERHNRDRHLRIHTGEKPYQCDVCEKRFSEKRDIERHLRIHTGEKPYKCDFCEKRFSEKYHLNNHLRTHTGERPFQCDICEKKFSHKQYMTNHLRTHIEEKTYQCDLCEKRFSQKQNMERHRRTHTGEKPYQCNVCEKRFTRKRYIAIHHRTHTREKPYKCDFCEKRFSRKDHMNNHHRTHTGEKAYQCDICEKKFAKKESMTRHHRIHTR